MAIRMLLQMSLVRGESAIFEDSPENFSQRR